MPDDDESVGQTKEPDAPGSVRTVPAPDQILASMADELNASHGSVTGRRVTLNVGGSLIVGQMIASTTWCELVIRQVQKAEVPGLATLQAAKAEFVSAGSNPYNTRFVHLQDVTMYVSSDRHTCKAWRGKLASVDGFAFEADA